MTMNILYYNTYKTTLRVMRRLGEGRNESQLESMMKGREERNRKERKERKEGKERKEKEGKEGTEGKEGVDDTEGKEEEKEGISLSPLCHPFH